MVHDLVLLITTVCRFDIKHNRRVRCELHREVHVKTMIEIESMLAFFKLRHLVQCFTLLSPIA